MKRIALTANWAISVCFLLSLSGCDQAQQEQTGAVDPCDRAYDRFTRSNEFAVFEEVTLDSYDESFKSKAAKLMNCLLRHYKDQGEVYSLLRSESDAGDRYASKVLGYLLVADTYIKADPDEGIRLLRSLASEDQEAANILDVYLTGPSLP